MKRRTLLPAGALLALFLAGCATSARSPTLTRAWSGRLALRLPDDPGQSFSAGFELRGSPREGELELLDPAGATLALLQWLPGLARLSGPGMAPRQAPSVDDLVGQLTSASLPVAALFDWLAGRPAQAPDWQVDLSARPQGRLVAHRLSPPRAELRLLLERP